MPNSTSPSPPESADAHLRRGSPSPHSRRQTPEKRPLRGENRHPHLPLHPRGRLHRTPRRPLRRPHGRYLLTAGAEETSPTSTAASRTPANPTSSNARPATGRLRHGRGPTSKPKHPRLRSDAPPTTHPRPRHHPSSSNPLPNPEQPSSSTTPRPVAAAVPAAGDCGVPPPVPESCSSGEPIISQPKTPPRVRTRFPPGSSQSRPRVPCHPDEGDSSGARGTVGARRGQSSSNIHAGTRSPAPPPRPLLALESPPYCRSAIQQSTWSRPPR